MEKFTLVFMVLLVSACSSMPTEVRVEKTVNLTQYEDINPSLASPEQLGLLARWAGKISRIYKGSGHTEIEIVYLPQDKKGRPSREAKSLGRFRAIFAGSVDPTQIFEGKYITVKGTVGDNQEGRIGDQKYRFPTLKEEGHYVWRSSAEIAELKRRHNAKFVHAYMGYGSLGRHLREMSSRGVPIVDASNRQRFRTK